MIKEAILKVLEKKDLSRSEMRCVMEEIMTGNATPAQIGSFLTALRIKTETIDEITGAAEAMREKADKIDLSSEKSVISLESKDISVNTIVDTCGTGGTGRNTFNISTTSAFVAAGAGIIVAKHGNKSVSGRCGSADVISALGININLTPEQVKQCLLKIGLGFMYAPLFHGAMKYAIGPRREIGIRTIFNILGPLTNPANAACQVLGVYEEKLCEMLALVLKNLGSRHAFVVHGLDNLDEITITARTKISELKDSRVRTYYIKPQDFGLPPASKEEIQGADAAENALITLNILKGEKGAKRNVVLLNSAAALTAGGKAKDLKEAVELAAEVIDTGRALKKLEDLREFTSKLTAEGLNQTG